MDLYPVSGLRPLDVAQDTFGMGGLKGERGSIGAFMSPSILLREKAEGEGFVEIPDARESMTELVARKVRERIGKRDAGLTIDDFESYGMGKVAKAPSAKKVAKQTATAARVAAIRAAAQKKLETKLARKQVPVQAKLDKVTKLKAHQQAMRDLKAAREEELRAVKKAQAALKLAKVEGKSSLAAARTQAKLDLIAATNAAKVAKQNAKQAQYQAQMTGAAAQEAGISANELTASYDDGSGNATYYPGYPTSGGEVSEPISPLLTPQYAETYEEVPAGYDPDMSEGEADQAQAYGEQEFDVGGAPEVESYDEPTAPIPSEGESVDEFEPDAGLFGLGAFDSVEVGKDGFMEVSIASSGEPRGTTPVEEDEGEQQSAVSIDARFRPPMLAESAKVGLPYKTGEGMQYLRKFSGKQVEIMDPSVVELDENDMVGRYGIDKVDFLEPMKFMGMGDLGDLPTAKDTAVNSAMIAMTSLATREAQLQQYNQSAFDNFMVSYAALRNSVNAAFQALQTAPEFDLGKSLTLTSTIALYKQALDRAVSAAKPKPVKVAAPPISVKRDLAPAVKETIFSKYGAVVIGGGALLVGGLLVANMMMKRRTA